MMLREMQTLGVKCWSGSEAKSTENEEYGGQLVAVLSQQNEGVLGGGRAVGSLLEVARQEVRQLLHARRTEEP